MSLEEMSARDLRAALGPAVREGWAEREAEVRAELRVRHIQNEVRRQMAGARPLTSAEAARIIEVVREHQDRAEVEAELLARTEDVARLVEALQRRLADGADARSAIQGAVQETALINAV